MQTNTNITIYNKYFDKTTRADKYKRIVINSVFWDENKAVNRIQSGLDSADKLLVVIPFRNAVQASYLNPKEFEGIEGTFTLQAGDRIVKGAIDYEITTKVTDLDKEYEAYTITSVDTKDFGSPHMRHWEIGAN